MRRLILLALALALAQCTPRRHNNDVASQRGDADPEPADSAATDAAPKPSDVEAAAPGDDPVASDDGYEVEPSDGSVPPAPPPDTGLTTNRDLALALGRPARLLIGLSEFDDAAMMGLGAPVDIYYRYLVGLPGYGGWTEWNPGGSYVNIVADLAERYGAVPMYTLYQMATLGDGELAGLLDPSFMATYWSATKLLFDRLALYGKPALVQLEPDFWGYCQKHGPGGDPTQLSALVSGFAPCADLPDDLTGMGRCLVRLARLYAPKTLVGFHASAWASGSAASVAQYLAEVGLAEADFVTIEMLDRDAGCFEAASVPECQRSGGPWYWDESNVTSPSFHEHFAWAAQLRAAADKPLLWWQVPLGVPSPTPGGTGKRYRDNRVRYVFAHPEELAATGAGVVFGPGATSQTDLTTDGGQFGAALRGYREAPAALP